MTRLALPLLSLCVALFALSGCQLLQDTVTFDPEPGDQRGYRLYTRAEFQMPSGTTRNDVVIESEGLVRYRMEDDGDLRLTPLNLCVSGQRKSRTYCSAWTGDRAPALAAVLRGGFRLGDGTGEDDGATWARALDGQALAALAEQDDDLGRLLPRQFPAPGLIAGLPAEPGAERRLDQVVGLPPLRAKVVAVTDQRVFATLREGRDGEHLSGVLVVERDSGWVERLAVVYESQDSMGREEPVRQLLALVPDDWEAGVLHRQYGEAHGKVPWTRMAPSPYLAAATVAGGTDDLVARAEVGEAPPLTEEQVFGSPIGAFKAETAWGMELFYDHPLWRDARDRFGRLVFQDPVVLDGDGEPLDLQFAGALPNTTVQTFKGSLETKVRLLPLGLEGVGERLEQVRGAAATARYYPPGPVKELALPVPAPGKVSEARTEDGIQVRLRVLDRRRAELLISGPGHYLSQLVVKEGAKTLPAKPDTSGPDWRRPGEAHLFQTLLGNGGARLLRLRLADGLDTLRVQVMAFADQPAFEKELRFLSKADHYNAVDVPPGVRIPLVADDKFAREEEMPLIQDDGDLTPRAMDTGAPVLRLSREQSGRCQLSAEVEGDGEAPRWRVIEHKRPTRPGADRQLPALLVWRLLSADGGPANEDGAVTFGLSCRQGQWRDADHGLGERPWLVDVRALTGEAPDPATPMPVFLGRYRFLDDNGQALGLLPPRYDHYWERHLSSGRLGDFLVDGRYLRIAGVPATVQQWQPGPVTEEKTWDLDGRR
ncbi:hypothetical protein [Alloalcanivorax gelatiniphagus]|uniref:Lipoprotein n=3 Tax=Alloalcanivorax gelatiniphagus TaxID=1194167 RepID=A0ABY2XLB1_9GAMM|nr:hypothetical protein [Alloalcanivorax gelatiniphagus]TMW12533.1 hypothetical protein FGS76_10590 [Alloalcanivorax gelatiniphagus]